MRTMILCFAILALIPVSSSASIVIHDGAPGIVAESGWQFLDSLGHVWRIEANGEFHRQAEWDVPMPVADIKFWADVRFVTTDDRFFWYDENQHIWIEVASWNEEVSIIEGNANRVRGAGQVSPNPSGGPCRISFQLLFGGPVSTRILDVKGRVVRQLTEGRYLAGDYSLVWDGRDDEGRQVPAGVYLTRITTTGGTSTGKVVLAR